MHARRTLVIGAVMAVLTLDVVLVQHAASPPAPAAPQLLVTVDSGQATLRADNAPLEAGLDELSTRTGIPIVAAPAAARMAKPAVEPRG
jgi:hypothetical protein